MKNKLNLLLVFLFVIANGYAQKGAKKVVKSKTITTQTTTPKYTEGIFAEFDTSKGKILVQLEYAKTPITVANFVSLAEGTNITVKNDLKGKPFYNGLKFHRVIADFMIQGGDPLGNGSGDPGYKFKDEFTDAKFEKAGILAMANSGPATNGSQFFITHKDTPWLNGKHTIFGYVVSGQDVVNTIAQDDVINKVVIIRKGALAKKFNASSIFTDYYAAKDINAKIEAEKAEKERAIANEVALKEFATGQTTTSGLKYIVLKEGSGLIPTAASNVKVHYTGSFTSGKVFDSSVQRGQPIDFNLNQVIKGWTEGLQLMKEGAKYKFFIPYNLAYGEQGYPGAIPAKSDLIFEVELIKINSDTKQ
ncbi:FKBP-type peptidyl-prolyl cis-trans isomerase [Flavobacterium psychrophilum DSM 3660]|uniref:peptidylprolyl isomerase n=1 Tax=Flavobacterium psychrophilum TaxID=96345 RepID=UPI0004F66AB4|nr:peptidylprolyl isomerase [Flavobacterium psychrophilum]AIN74350.1 peptidylprolyl isomerase [Flavobacterium psychrophilum FPG3]MBF2044786.1 peptidylprolyl isomerase [Flavobacterium psychrophilum]OXB10759.1 peptidylprolyl isomerase [Flavobacterium psychrophilum DSM 3660 = ATCC 49418]SCY35763.1 FKBP-type peptidyl-prolyl cis-trans isomerase [Flavobacterium psychrophilum DSM 3660] [Flavobacterium psychrophilum DSM 3660 = ATCC 49418]